MLKKGAMFGLDARIALAIFGALSVISGAALYSAIQQSKTTAFATDLAELAKAFEAYYLDVGPALAIVDVANYEAGELVKSTKPGWKGPYISYTIDSRHSGSYLNKFLRYEKIGDSSIFFSKLMSSTFPSASPSCVDDSDCAMYLTLSSGSSSKDDLARYRQLLDEMIDNGDGLAKGKVKGFNYSGNSGVYLYYKIMDFRQYQ